MLKVWNEQRDYGDRPESMLAFGPLAASGSEASIDSFE